MFNKIIKIITYILILSSFAFAQEKSDLTDLSLEDLMEVSVTSVAKREQKISQAAAAIFVISSEDIRRSTANNVPELLRMVPGIQVARISTNLWAISSRGFNSLFANKLLVLIDGRSVYTPLFSGVYWDEQEIMLEDVARIEVIRGPGASLWGANAVNGVINIISKKAAETQGSLVSVAVGSEDNIAAARFGDKTGNGAYRGYVRAVGRDDSERISGVDNYDGWYNLKTGFKYEWQNNKTDSYSLQSDIYRGQVDTEIKGTVFTAPYSQIMRQQGNVQGGNLIFKWEHQVDIDSETSLQVYFDNVQRDDIFLDQARSTFDLDFQHSIKINTSNQFIYGVGLRSIYDNIESTDVVMVSEESRQDQLYSAFAQDTYEIINDKLELTVGTKFEHNEFSGASLQPNARIVWHPSSQHSVWAAVSKAVRNPSRVDQDLKLNVAVIPNEDTSLNVVSINGQRGFESEKQIAYEIGYRYVPANNLSFDLAGFVAEYDDLSSVEPGAVNVDVTTTPIQVNLPRYLSNTGKASSYGVELASDYKPIDWATFKLAYTYLTIFTKTDEGSLDTTFGTAEDESPSNQFNLRALFDLSSSVEFDANFRFVDNLTSVEVPSYNELDLRLAWKIKKNLEVALVGQNLLHDSHKEFKATFTPVTQAQLERAVFGKLTWKF